MDHVNAVNDRSAERYLLEEMSANEADEFERHYFECEECALAVEAGQVFVANARAVFSEAEPERFPEQSGSKHGSEAPRESLWLALTAWWTKPATLFPALASLMLGALALYQGAVVIPGLRSSLGEPRVLPAFQLAMASRGEGSSVVVAAGAPSFAVSVDMPPDAHFLGYLCELSAAGHTVFSLNAAPPADGQAITILVPTNKVRAGSYELSIYGQDGNGRKLERISTFSFALKFR